MLKRKQCWKYFKENIAGDVLKNIAGNVLKKALLEMFNENLAGNVL